MFDAPTSPHGDHHGVWATTEIPGSSIAPRELRAAATTQKHIPWQEVHTKLMGLASAHAALDWEVGAWLLRARRAQVHRRLGYGSFLEYAERLFGHSPRLVHEKLRVAEALEKLPELTRALRSGALAWSGVRELARVATAETEGEWLAAVRDKTVRQVERLTSGRVRGDRPTDAPKADARRHVLRFEVSATVLATFREALAKIRREAGSGLDDDSALLLLARQVLEGPRNHGTASYQVSLSICDDCRRTRQRAHGELIDVNADIAAAAECDAQLVSLTHLDGAIAAEPSCLPPLTQASAGAKAATHASSPHVGAEPTPRAVAQPASAVALAAARESHSSRQRTPLASHADVSARATQTIPPAVRRAVLLRDAGCCVFPGCRHATFVDVHHLQPRSAGGRHVPENLITLCSAHHLSLHRGTLMIEGTCPTGLRFRHADGTPYGSARVAATEVDARAKAFRALRNLGFGECQVRRALDQLKDARDWNVSELVRRGLRLLERA